MRPTKDYSRLYNQFCFRLDSYRKSFQGSALTLNTKGRKKVIGSITINLQNQWSNFLKAYYLSMVFGPKRIKKGRLQGLNYVSYADAMNAAAQCLMRRRINIMPNGLVSPRDEPKWYITRNFLTVCQNANCHHLAQIQSAFSLGLTVFDSLPTYRNYFAHKNANTKLKAINKNIQNNIPSRLSPYEALIYKRRHRPQALLLDWIDEIQITAELLCD